MGITRKRKWLIGLLLCHAAISITMVSLVSVQYMDNIFIKIKWDLAGLIPYLLAMSALLGSIAIVLTIEIFQLLETEAEGKLTKKKLVALEQSNLELREQRHDFLNHLQVISGLIQINRSDQAHQYLIRISDTLVMKDDDVLALESEVGMLIYSKQKIAKELQVVWDQSIEFNMGSLAIDKVELVRILGNILDNALYELKKVPAGKRRLELKGYVDGDKGVLVIANHGSALEPHLLDKVFAPGFTTKTNQGDGMGLHIVKTLVEKWGGSVKLTSSTSSTKERYTLITIMLPMDKRQLGLENFSLEEMSCTNHRRF